MADRAGERVGPYQVEGEVGWGGFARVYQVHTEDGTPLLLKVADQSGQGTLPGPVRPPEPSSSSLAAAFAATG